MNLIWIPRYRYIRCSHPNQALKSQSIRSLDNLRCRYGYVIVVMVGGKEDNSEINDMFRHDWVPPVVLPSQMDRFMVTKYSTSVWRKVNPDIQLWYPLKFYYTWVLRLLRYSGFGSAWYILYHQIFKAIPGTTAKSIQFLSLKDIHAKGHILIL